MKVMMNVEFGAHQCFRNMVAHYLSPLHLCSGLIYMAYKTRRRPIRRLLLSCVHVYDIFYRNILRLT